MESFFVQAARIFILYPELFYTSIFILGLMIGSFLNVVIHRLPVMMEREWRSECEQLLDDSSDNKELEPYNLIVPRSACTACDHKISAIENIPVISYLVLKGRCSACKTPISFQYPLIEIITALLSVWVVTVLGIGIPAIAALLFTWGLIALSVIDIKHTLLPDSITLPFLWLGLLFNINGLFAPLSSAVVGAVAGYLSLWSLYHVFKWITKKEGMGYGDFKLFALFGAWMGWQALPGIIVLSSFVGALTGIALIAFAGRDKQLPIPFGPFLAVAGWLYLLYGVSINNLYLDLIKL